MAVPITVPYVRYSTHTAHWFIGQAVEALVKASGVAKEQIDGLCLSSLLVESDHCPTVLIRPRFGLGYWVAVGSPLR